MFAKGKAAGIETRGISDHDFIHSIYFRDPNGYVIELTAKTATHDAALDPSKNGARERLAVGRSGTRSRSSEVENSVAKGDEARNNEVTKPWNLVDSSA